MAIRPGIGSRTWTRLPQDAQGVFRGSSVGEGVSLQTKQRLGVWFGLATPSGNPKKSLNLGNNPADSYVDISIRPAV
jgi:hypothetical protein